MNTNTVEPPAFEAKNLWFRYPAAKQETLRDISFVIRAGERVALLGENGAGKSTLLLHFNALHRPTSGELLIFGRPATPQEVPAIRRRVGMVFQNPDDQLFAPTVGEDIGFGPIHLGLTKPEVDERTHHALSQVGLSADLLDKPPSQLSIGQKKRVAIAGVLAMRPDVLVLDEPFSSLDPRGRRELAELLATIGGTQINISHDLHLTVPLCPRSLVLHQGRLVRDGGPEVLEDQAFLRSVGLA